MREIKFRAWDKEKCKYVHQLNTPLFIQLFGDVIIDKTGNRDFAEVNEQYIVEQFTGLKDRNGREIYEGDIVAFENAIGLEDDYGAIQYESSRYGFYIENEKTGLWEELFNISCAFLEVIGNIHENGELLQ